MEVTLASGMTSTPSRNLTPWMIFGNGFLSRRSETIGSCSFSPFAKWRQSSRASERHSIQKRTILLPVNNARRQLAKFSAPD